jgi:hypothetical protein
LGERELVGIGWWIYEMCGGVVGLGLEEIAIFIFKQDQKLSILSNFPKSSINSTIIDHSQREIDNKNSLTFINKTLILY